MVKVKVGIVGVGTLGKLHGKNLKYKIPNAELIAVCATTQEKVEMLQEEWDIPYGYTNYEEMMQNKELDAIVIASATYVHYEHAMLAINAGKHVFIEKPMGMTEEECVKVQTAAEQSKQIFTVGFMRRYEPSCAQAKKMIDQGEIGQPILYRGYSMDPEWVAEYLAKRAEENGYWFLDMGVHEYDLARWFLGSEPQTVFACGGAYSYPVFDKKKDVDNGYALISFQNKAAAFIYVGKTAPHGTHVETEIVGTKGIIRICDDAKNSHIKLYGKDGVQTYCYQDYLERWEKAFYLELEDFIECIAQGRKPEITAKDGYYATMMGNVVQTAYETKQLENFRTL